MDTIHTLYPGQFPPLLEEIPDKPKQLHLRGTFPDPTTHKFLAVVGSRKYTDYGKEVVNIIIRDLADYPISIISGLALGIDAHAHRKAIEHNLPTIAVPGSGIHDDALFPATHRSLAHEILEKGGCIVSEFDPFEKAATWTFPVRNRIMAGLSHATLVIEAAHESGTLITARLAMEYNRDVLAVPGSIFSHNSQGPHTLIKQGAVLVQNATDILEMLGLEKREIKSRDIIVSDEERRVLDVLLEPQTKDEIIRTLGIPVYKANSLLTSLEIKGVIVESMGKIRLR